MRRPLLIRVITLLWLGGCGDDASLPPDEPDPPALTGACPAELAELRTGNNGTLSMDASGAFAVRITDAPVPLANGFNDVEVAVVNASGMPLPNAQLTWVCAWMPVHMHGSTPKRLEKLGDGRFKLVRQNLTMSGPWELRFWVAPDGDAEDFQPDTKAGGLNGDACSPSNASEPIWNIKFDVCVPDR